MSTRPMAFDIVTPANGQPHLRIRSAGNRTVIAVTETYGEARSAANVVHLIVEAIQSGQFIIRYVTDDGEPDETPAPVESAAVQGVS